MPPRVHEFRIEGLAVDPAAIPAMDLLEWAAGALAAAVGAGFGVTALVMRSCTEACIFDAGDPDVGPLAERFRALGAVAYVLDMRLPDGRRYLMTTDRGSGEAVLATIDGDHCVRITDPDLLALAPAIPLER